MITTALRERSRQLTALALALLTVLNGVFTTIGVHTPIRLYVTVAFLLLAPGWALAAFLRDAGPALVWSVAVCLGLAVGILLAQTMVTATFFKPALAMLALDGLTLGLLLYHITIAPPVRPTGLHKPNERGPSP
ncbi:MAG: hypothetical protein ACRDRL_04830 [Sciscionella sp.]